MSLMLGLTEIMKWVDFKNSDQLPLLSTQFLYLKTIPYDPELLIGKRVLL